MELQHKDITSWTSGTATQGYNRLNG